MPAAAARWGQLSVLLGGLGTGEGLKASQLLGPVVQCWWNSEEVFQSTNVSSALGCVQAAGGCALPGWHWLLLCR